MSSSIKIIQNTVKLKHIALFEKVEYSDRIKTTLNNIEKYNDMNKASVILR